MGFFPENISRHGMSEDQLAAQWVMSPPDRRLEIVRDALGRGATTETIQSLSSNPNFHKLVKKLNGAEIQTVANRLAMDAGYMD